MGRSLAPPEVIAPAHYEQGGTPHAAFEKLRSEVASSGGS